MQEDMERYKTRDQIYGSDLVDDYSNALTLRSDIHTVFDRKAFIFTRKLDDWVSHVLGSTCHVGEAQHNVAIEIPSGVHQALLLTRIAWAVFPLILNFLKMGGKRLVRVRSQSATGSEDKELTYEALSKIVRELPIQSKGKSPTKRKRGEESHDAIASKRRRVEDDDQDVNEANSSTTTPDLVKLEKSSDAWQLPSPEVDKADTIAARCRDALFAQRKAAAHLMCCDYDAAEAAIAAGIQGPRKFSGAHICLECRGVEYLDDGTFGDDEDRVDDEFYVDDEVYIDDEVCNAADKTGCKELLIPST